MLTSFIAALVAIQVLHLLKRFIASGLEREIARLHDRVSKLEAAPSNDRITDRGVPFNRSAYEQWRREFERAS